MTSVRGLLSSFDGFFSHSLASQKEESKNMSMGVLRGRVIRQRHTTDARTRHHSMTTAKGHHSNFRLIFLLSASPKCVYQSRCASRFFLSPFGLFVCLCNLRRTLLLLTSSPIQREIQSSLGTPAGEREKTRLSNFVICRG